MTNHDLACQFQATVAQMPFPTPGWAMCRQAIDASTVNIADYIATRGTATGLSVLGVKKPHHTLIEEIVRQNIAASRDNTEPNRQEPIH